MHPVFTDQLPLIHLLLAIVTLYSGITESNLFLEGGAFLVVTHLVIVIRVDIYRQAAVWVIICWLLGALLLKPWYYGVIWGSVLYGIIYLLVYGGMLIWVKLRNKEN